MENWKTLFVVCFINVVMRTMPLTESIRIVGNFKFMYEIMEVYIYTVSSIPMWNDFTVSVWTGFRWACFSSNVR